MDGAWINCNNCGYRHGAWISSCPKCGAKNSTYKGKGEKTGKVKKIGIGAGIVVGAFFVLLIVAALSYSGNQGSRQMNESISSEFTGKESTSASNVDQNRQTAESQHDNIQVNGAASKSVLDLLPTRSDIGTEWRISPIMYNNTNSGQGYLGNSNDILSITAGTKAIGYEDKVSQDFTSNAVVKVTISSFDSPTNAKNYYNSITTKLYNAGGFKQISTASIKAECFSVFKDFDLAQISEFYCLKDNVFFTIRENGGIYNSNNDVEDTTTKFAEIIADNINSKISSNTRLGASSFPEFARMICQDDSACVTTLASANHNISGCDILANTNDCISAYASKFNEPARCDTASDSLDCFKTVSVRLGLAVCKMAGNEQAVLDCVSHYFPHADSSNTQYAFSLQNECTRSSRALVKEIACDFENKKLDGITAKELMGWKRSEHLLVCEPYYTPAFYINGDHKDDICIAALGVYYKDLSICDQSASRGECYGFVADTEDFVTLDTCNKLGENGTTFCYMHVAKRLDDISICEKAGTDKDNCEYLVKNREQF